MSTDLFADILRRIWPPGFSDGPLTDADRTYLKMLERTPDTFTCGMCHETFEKGLTDEEAAAECETVFGQRIPVEDRAVVCDPCYVELMEEMAPAVGDAADA